MGGGMGGGPMGGGPGGRGQQESQGQDNEELVREVRKVRDELHDIRRELERIGEALQD
jgi:hypothetical protein